MGRGPTGPPMTSRSARLALALGLVAVVAIAALALPRLRSAPRFREAPGPFPTDYFAMQREYPGIAVPNEKVRLATERALSTKAPANETNAGLVWTQAGPYNIGGRVTALAALNGGRTVYLGSANGGVFKSTNSGVNWTPVFDKTGVYSIGALAIDPADTNLVYAGTGEANSAVQSYDGAGLWRTRNGGGNWEYLGLAETRRIGKVAIDPANPLRLYVAAMGTQFSTGPDRGLYRSEDGGVSWTKTFFLNDSVGVCDVVVNPAHPETVYIASWERVRHYTYRRAYGPGCGIWRSADHGTTWTRLQNGLPLPSDDVGRIGLALAPSQPSTIYAQIVSGAALGYVGLGLYRSLDAGETWTRRDLVGGTFANAFGGFGWYFGAIAVDPVSPGKIFCMGVSCLVSADGGATFTNVTGSAHVDFHAMWIDPTNPTRVYAGSDGGFFWSNSGGGAWTKSVDLPISQFYANSAHPTDPLKVYGGTQDNGCLKSTVGPPNWSAMNIGGDGMVVLVDPVNPNTVFAEYQYGCYGSGPARSIDNGGSFTLPTGTVTTDRWGWVAPIAMNPKNHNVVLTASHRVYRSTNNGVTYSAISGDLTRAIPSSLVFSTITCLDVSAPDTSLYYAATDDGRVWRSQNRGSTWEDITAGLPIRWVTRVTADPANSQVVYATLSGFGQDESLAHVYRSADRGTSWSSVAGNLPDIPANDLVVDPVAPSTLYLATDVGVWVTRTLGASWYPLGLGMPVQTIWDLHLQNASRTLIAATYGRSQWKLDLTAMPVAVEPAPAAPRLALGAPSPNPASGVVHWTLTLAAAGAVRMAIYDVSGRLVRSLHDGALRSGEHAFAWDGRDARGALAPSGAYFVRATAGGASATRRIVRSR